MSRKYFNDGDGDDAPRFIPAGKKSIDSIPVGKEKEYIKDAHGDWWKKSDWEKMRIK